MPRRLLPAPSSRRRATQRSFVPVRRRSLDTRLMAAVALLFAVIAATPGSAGAATYAIRQCNDGAGRGLAVTPDFVQIWEDRPISNSCEANGSLSMNLPTNTLAPYGAEATRMMGFSFVLPAAMPNAKLTRAVATLWVPPATADPNLSDMQVALHSEGNPVEYDRLHNFSYWGGLPHVARGGDLPVPSRFARFLVYCWAPCGFQSTPSMALDAATLTIDDPLPPTAPNVEPSGLLDGTVQKGTKPLRFGVTDADSGIRRIELRSAAGAQLAVVDGQGCSYTRPIPCPQERTREEFAVDTTRLADGKQTLELWTTDAAGNLRKTTLAAITVQNAAVPASSPTPAPGVGAPTPTPAPTPQSGATPGGGTAAPGPSDANPAGATAMSIAFQVSSKAPRRGMRVVFSGAVTPVPATAGRVMIEAKSGRKKWITAAVVRTREGGAFTWAHTFSRRGTYTMRARLLTSVESKTKPATSPKRTFRVR